MAKVKLELESNFGEGLKAFEGLSTSISQTKTEVKSLGDEGAKAFEKVTTEADDMTKSVKKGNEEVKDLGNASKGIIQSVNRMKQLKQEIKDLTNAAIEAGEGTELFTENLNKAGELKDELADLQAVVAAVSGNLKENLFNALGTVTTFGAKAFEGVTAASNLFGFSVGAAEEQIKKLQAIQSLANISKDFAGIGDTVTQLKVALGPVAAAYANANAGLMSFAKNANFSFKGLASGAAGLGKSLVSGFSGFIKAGISGFKSLGAVISANPLGLILLVITAIIGILVLMKDKIKPVAAVFEFIGDLIDVILDALEDLGQFLGIVASDAEQAAQASIDAASAQVDALEKRYGREIKLAQAAGRDTSKIEQDKLASQAATVNGALRNLEFLKKKQGELNEDQLKQQQEYSEQYKDIQTDLVVSILEQQKEARKKEEEENKKKQEAAKKYAEERKKLQQDLSNALLELFKKAEQAELATLTGEARINKIKEIQQRELDLLRKTIEEKGKLVNKNFKFSIEQEEQFAILQQQINQEAADSLVKIAIEKGNAVAEQRKKEIDSELELLELKQKIAIEEANLVTKPADVSEADFELIKQKNILAIQKDFAAQSLALKEEQLEAERQLQIQGLKNELASLAGKNDEESNLKRQQIEAGIGVINEKFDLENDLLKKQTQNQIDGIAEQIQDIDKKLEGGKKFSLAKLLGVSDSDFAKLKEGLEGFATAVVDTINQVITSQQAQLDQELSLSEERVSASDDRISDLEEQLGSELELQRQGLASNVDNVKDQIAAEQAARAAELEQQKKIQEEKKKLAKIQFAIDTAQQGSNLITSATNIYKSLSPLGPIGIALAIGTIAAMVGGFVLARTKMLQSINNQPAAGFAKGVIDLKGPGTGTSDSIDARLSRGESVMTAEETKNNLNLFKGIREDDPKLIQLGILDLLKNTGVTLPIGLPKELSSKKDKIRKSELLIMSRNDNSGVEKRLDILGVKFEVLNKKVSNKSFINQNGDLEIHDNGSIRIIKKKQ